MYNSFSIAHASNISSQPYYLFITLLKDIFKISEVDSLSVSKEKLDNTAPDINEDPPQPFKVIPENQKMFYLLIVGTL